MAMTFPLVIPTVRYNDGDLTVFALLSNAKQETRQTQTFEYGAGEVCWIGGLSASKPK